MNSYSLPQDRKLENTRAHLAQLTLQTDSVIAKFVTTATDELFAHEPETLVSFKENGGVAVFGRGEKAISDYGLTLGNALVTVESPGQHSDTRVSAEGEVTISLAIGELSAAGQQREKLLASTTGQSGAIVDTAPLESTQEDATAIEAETPEDLIKPCAESNLKRLLSVDIIRRGLVEIHDLELEDSVEASIMEMEDLWQNEAGGHIRIPDPRSLLTAPRLHPA